MQRFVRHLLFVYVVAIIGVVGSERMFWYWTDGIGPHLEGAVFYSLCTAGFLAVLRRFEVHSWWGVILALPVYAYVTEGVITPVVYSGGPTPFFPLWFTGWHGLLSMLLLFGVVRAWAIRRRTAAIAGLSVGLGVFWGTWLITSLLPEQVGDTELIESHGQLTVMEPAEFAGYAAMFTAILLVAHLLLDRVWPAEPSRLFARTERGLAALLLVGAAMWTVAAPWALPMFAGLCWLQFRVLRRHRSLRPADAPTVLEAWRGPASARSLLALAAMAPVAAATYLMWWELAPSEAVLNGIYYGVIVAQTIAAAVLLVLAWRRCRPAATAAVEKRSAEDAERAAVSPAPSGDGAATASADD